MVPIRESQRLAQKLQENQIPHFLLELPWATHGCEANLFGPSGQISLYAIKHFLLHVLKKQDRSLMNGGVFDK